jgi:hypothetical protein
MLFFLKVDPKSFRIFLGGPSQLLLLLHFGVFFFQFPNVMTLCSPLLIDSLQRESLAGLLLCWSWVGWLLVLLLFGVGCHFETGCDSLVLVEALNGFLDPS